MPQNVVLQFRLPSMALGLHTAWDGHRCSLTGGPCSKMAEM